ncbi:ABC transporter substrate-binding protein [Xylanibacter muris]|uniref:ABC transporter substrate-binding protein n=2 Tax=Xylanibacter muris TaxID=2736290 RepID=A0ABX2AMQ4_9BACT|nr:ABC transporter substrate-binding protein [Xylanibacter muris]NPD91465.1 ABC transporter substrate-binding protein [Xylanibacter muris]
MRNLFYIFIVIVFFSACGDSYQEKKRLSRQERLKLMKEDSAAMKIAVTPTFDCLPLFVAKSSGLFERLGADIRLKHYNAQMDCDTELEKGRVEGAVTDLVRGEWMKIHGTSLVYVTSTNACWQIISNFNSRIRRLKQLDDKMVAMARHAATDFMAWYAVDSAGLKPERVFRIQINDVGLRLKMLVNNEMDAAVLPEPQASVARMHRHGVLADTRKLGFSFGVIAFRSGVFDNDRRKKQKDVFVRAYNMAVDSINGKGIGHYKALIHKYCNVDESVVGKIPEDIKFRHISEPRTEDIARASAWIKENYKD